MATDRFAPKKVQVNRKHRVKLNLLKNGAYSFINSSDGSLCMQRVTNRSSV